MGLRILMLNSEFPPLGGGTSTANEHIIRQLAKMDGVQIDLVTSSPSKRTCEVQTYLPGVRVFRVPVNVKNYHHATYRQLLTYTWRAMLVSLDLSRQSSYDVCLAFCTVPAGVIALILSYLNNLPFLVRLSGADILGFEKQYDSIDRILAPLIRLTWRKAQWVISKCANEEAMAKNFYSHFHSVIISNAVDLERFQNAASSRSQASETVNLLCVARLTERKGHHHLLEAFRLLIDRGHSKFKLVLVGQGNDEAKIRRKAHELDLEDWVEFRGYVSRENMPQVYASAHVFALFPFNESLSMAALEAMASGLPMVVTRGTGLEELIDKNGYTVLWGDTVALADALEKLAWSKELRQEMGEQSQRVVQRFNWSEVGRAYFLLLSSCTSSGIFHASSIMLPKNWTTC